MDGKKIIEQIENCNHIRTKKDDMFENARVCLDCGLVIFK